MPSNCDCYFLKLSTFNIFYQFYLIQLNNLGFNFAHKLKFRNIGLIGQINSEQAHFTP